MHPGIKHHVYNNSQRPVYSGINSAFTIETMQAKRPIDLALELWLARKGASKASLARELNVLPQDIKNWKARGLPPARHAAVAALLGISVEQLLGLSTPLTHGPSSLNEPPATYAALQQARKADERLRVSELLRTIEGGALEPVQSTERDDLGFVDLHGSSQGLLALRVQGDGLSPAIEDGEVIVIDLNALPQPGERVIIELHGDVRLCKRLLFARVDSMTVSDLATKAQSTLRRSDVRRVLAISAIYSSNRWTTAEQ